MSKETDIVLSELRALRRKYELLRIAALSVGLEIENEEGNGYGMSVHRPRKPGHDTLVTALAELAQRTFYNAPNLSLNLAGISDWKRTVRVILSNAGIFEANPVIAPRMEVTTLVANEIKHRLSSLEWAHVPEPQAIALALELSIPVISLLERHGYVLCADEDEASEGKRDDH